MERLTKIVYEACDDLKDVKPDAILRSTTETLYDNIQEHELSQALVMSARTLIEQDPAYSFVAARLLLDNLRHEALSTLYGKNTLATLAEMEQHYPVIFPIYVQKAVGFGLLSPHTLEGYDLVALGNALDFESDLKFNYLGLQTLYDRYFIHHQQDRIELPQCFFMRVAMGLATNEENKTERAIAFYKLLSSFDFMCSTPTLFNSATPRPQLLLVT